MILVTGAKGFVGQALCAELARRQMDYRPVSRAPKPGFVAMGTFDGATDWARVLAGVETVVHLAARVHVMNDTSSDPLAAFRAANVDATVNLARQAARAGVKRFIFLSSIKVNGEATVPGRPFRASDMPHPEDPYGQSKREAEEALLAIGAETGMEIVVIRPPLVYGPGVKANFASLMKWAGRPFPWPFGLVTNRRSLVFVGNLVDFILLSAHHPAAGNRVFLISDGADLSIGELIGKLSTAMGRKALLLPIPPRLLEGLAALLGRRAAAQRLLGSLQVDIGETMAITGWSPPYSVDEGLQLAVAASPGDR
ncbi:NAD-dependent epimerase/dehydratase family protein [Agrobacterium rhizogenes]|uniref:NAD-dependent epimerase/dehydratase family protein n=1 Tax=Rhizobium rhizogenes TaxID=359 RepID=UPI00115CF170|nr:NAD-dependent epimerase/dehydratase family protein [Rhizobium rhizogenes]NTG29279.1 NAD-dependent epimerase/dehydratase family protein [Rhizobium rhizogenes]TRB17412.1 NAD-dependent epimerase/dehydratase family protein [Rhizobium rhizogenes]